MANTLDGNSLGNVTSVDEGNQSELDIMTLPGGNTGDTFISEFDGPQRELTIKGNYVDTTANIKTALGLIRALQNAGFQAGVTLALDVLDANITVFVKEFRVNWDVPALTKATYTLTVAEGF